MRNVFHATLSAALITIGSLSPAIAGGPYDRIGPPTWTAGGVLVISPKYEGSKSHDVTGIPYIFPSFSEASSLVAMRGPDDVRLRLFNHGAFVAGPLVGYKFDRESSDGRKLRGWGDVDGGLVLGAFAGYRLLPWLTFDVSYHRTVTGDVDGGQLRFGLEYEAPVSDRLTLLGRVGATYADDDYMAAYFGVTAAQAAASAAFANLPQYNAGAGFKDVHVGVGARIQIDPRWALTIGSRYGRLVGDAADSPVIETKDQISGFANLTFKFGSGW
jgi:MipA family protein